MDMKTADIPVNVPRKRGRPRMYEEGQRPKKSSKGRVRPKKSSNGRGRPKKYISEEVVSPYFPAAILTPKHTVQNAKTYSLKNVAITNSRPSSNESHVKRKNNCMKASEVKKYIEDNTAIPSCFVDFMRVNGERVVCNFCGIDFEGKHVLKDHLRSHLCLKCLVCNLAFTHLEQFKCHMVEHSTTSPGKFALTESSSIMEVETNVEEAKSIIPTRKLNVSAVGETRRHNGAESGEVLDGESTPNLNKSGSSVSCSKNTTRKPFVCESCYFQAWKKRYWCLHIRNVHNSPNCICGDCNDASDAFEDNVKEDSEAGQSQECSQSVDTNAVTSGIIELISDNSENNHEHGIEICPNAPTPKKKAKKIKGDRTENPRKRGGSSKRKRISPYEFKSLFDNNCPHTVLEIDTPGKRVTRGSLKLSGDSATSVEASDSVQISPLVSSTNGISPVSIKIPGYLMGEKGTMIDSLVADSEQGVSEDPQILEHTSPKCLESSSWPLTQQQGYNNTESTYLLPGMPEIIDEGIHDESPQKLNDSFKVVDVEYIDTSFNDSLLENENIPIDNDPLELKDVGTSVCTKQTNDLSFEDNPCACDSDQPIQNQIIDGNPNEFILYKSDEVPDLEEGQFIVHCGVFRRFGVIVKRSTEFKSKLAYLNYINNEFPPLSVPLDNVISSESFLCDYRFNNKITMPIASSKVDGELPFGIAHSISGSCISQIVGPASFKSIEKSSECEGNLIGTAGPVLDCSRKSPVFFAMSLNGSGTKQDHFSAKETSTNPERSLDHRVEDCKPPIPDYWGFSDTDNEDGDLTIPESLTPVIMESNETVGVSNDDPSVPDNGEVKNSHLFSPDNSESELTGSNSIKKYSGSKRKYLDEILRKIDEVPLSRQSQLILPSTSEPTKVAQPCSIFAQKIDSSKSLPTADNSCDRLPTKRSFESCSSSNRSLTNSCSETHEMTFGDPVKMSSFRWDHNRINKDHLDGDFHQNCRKDVDDRREVCHSDNFDHRNNECTGGMAHEDGSLDFGDVPSENRCHSSSSEPDCIDDIILRANCKREGSPSEELDSPNCDMLSQASNRSPSTSSSVSLDECRFPRMRSVLMSPSKMKSPPPCSSWYNDSPNLSPISVHSNDSSVISLVPSYSNDSMDFDY